MPDLPTRWTYRRSDVAVRVHLKRWRSWLLGRASAPQWEMVRPPMPASRWNVLFLFVPSGELHHDQRQILDRMRKMSGSLLAIIALPRHLPVPALDAADAVIRKELGGFDFSAYRIALQTIADRAPGATVYIQNDSVFGPFGDIERLVREAPWDLTGFIGARAVENHLSSFAFILRDVTLARVEALHPVLSPVWSCDAFDDVILLQETRLARIASRTMSVGAYWYVPTRPLAEHAFVRLFKRLTGRNDRRIDVAGDATLACAIELLDAGFPFMKRSLFGKFAGLHDPAALRSALHRHGWSVPTMAEPVLAPYR